MEDTIYISPNDVEVIDASEYKGELTEHFGQVPEVARLLLNEAKFTFTKIEKALYTAPAFINAVKATIPDTTLQAVLTNEQKQQIANGALQLMTKKDGLLMANLVNPETKKIVSTIPLKSVKMAPEMTQAMMNFSAQMQMVQIAEQIQYVQLAVEEVRMGQEYDRLATAYSCQQKLLQALEIKDSQLKAMALIQLVSSAEDSRNLLMLSQKTNVEFITSQPENFFQKMLSGASKEKIDSRMEEIRESLCAVNMVSFAEALAYQELGEHEAAKKSLTYYAGFIEDTYVSIPGLVERLDMIDPSPENYWSKTLPDISKKVKELPSVADTIFLDDKPK
ncbi:hypothetical protein MMJ01_09605 [Enterococcus cecorum]|uniref:hypothetical protein n=1 Tax=Enterococcus cecorum TaxID=44008 RepID=UPI001FAC5E76|nr:hypothetical protein [Enterococcus cecorum]MCJ0595368.1 hypothetical protein [Enterococcus cecorum]MCJ0597619.1 hypothetical protein [Enterococcus cecorum]